MITIENLNKNYGSKIVLKGIRQSFTKGKVYGIVGANGAGKTTLFNCIAGLTDYRGTIKSNLQPLKNHLGLLPTQPYFMTKITGWEYLKLLRTSRGIRQDNFDQKNIFELPLQQYASTYSTGMQKKLALMGILLQKNEVYILDEPFNGVDIQSNMIIMALIRQLKKAGKTILIASHIFSTLRDSCDEILFLKNGEFQQKVLPEDFEKLDRQMQGEIPKVDVGIFD